MLPQGLKSMKTKEIMSGGKAVLYIMIWVVLGDMGVKLYPGRPFNVRSISCGPYIHAPPHILPGA